MTIQEPSRPFKTLQEHLCTCHHSFISGTLDPVLAASHSISTQIKSFETAIDSLSSLSQAVQNLAVFPKPGPPGPWKDLDMCRAAMNSWDHVISCPMSLFAARTPDGAVVELWQWLFLLRKASWLRSFFVFSTFCSIFLQLFYTTSSS